MNPIFLQICLVISGQLVGAIITIYLVRWRKAEDEPGKLHKEVVDAIKELREDWERGREIADKELNDLSKALVVVRGQVKYLEGRMNFKAWKQEHGKEG